MTNTIHLAEILTFLASGIVIGYDGVSTLLTIPSAWVIGTVGEVALLAALGLLFYRREFTARPT